jgi:hypothetical protein
MAPARRRRGHAEFLLECLLDAVAHRGMTVAERERGRAVASEMVRAREAK